MEPGYIAVFITLVCTFVGYVELKNAEYFLSHGKLAKGIVLEYKRRYISNLPVVRFNTKDKEWITVIRFKTEDKEWITAELNVASNYPKSVGQEIEVYYDPDNPRDCWMHPGVSPKARAYLLFFGAIISLLFGFLSVFGVLDVA